jgi:hypothetical protein
VPLGPAEETPVQLKASPDAFPEADLGLWNISVFCTLHLSIRRYMGGGVNQDTHCFEVFRCGDLQGGGAPLKAPIVLALLGGGCAFKGTP